MADVEVRDGLPRHPKVYALSAHLEITRAEVVGYLVMFWGWCQDHAEEGGTLAARLEAVDAATRPGFAAALLAPDVGWLERDGDRLVVPRFERVRSERAKAAERQRRRRERLRAGVSRDCHVTSRDMSRDSAPPQAPDPPAKPAKAKGDPDAWREVLARPAYESLRADPAFMRAWTEWTEYVAAREHGTKATYPIPSRTAAGVFNRVLEGGVPRFVAAVEEGMVKGWMVPFPEYVKPWPRTGSNGAPQSTYETPGRTALRELFEEEQRRA